MVLRSGARVVLWSGVGLDINRNLRPFLRAPEINKKMSNNQ